MFFSTQYTVLLDVGYSLFICNSYDLFIILIIFCLKKKKKIRWIALNIDLLCSLAPDPLHKFRKQKKQTNKLIN